MLTSRFAPLAVCVLAIACGNSMAPPTDSGSTPQADSGTSSDVDAGTVAHDGGHSSTPDGGHTPPEVDAGGPVDCSPRTFVVTTPGFFYAFDGMDGMNPPLVLCRGVTYQFDLTGVDTFHPMVIGGGGPTLTGGATHSYTVPSAAPFPTDYHCGNHGFGSTITVP